MIALLYKKDAPFIAPPLIKFECVKPVIKSLGNLFVVESLLCNVVVSTSNIILLLPDSVIFRMPLLYIVEFPGISYVVVELLTLIFLD